MRRGWLALVVIGCSSHAPPTPVGDAGPDAPTVNALTHTLYLNFEGVTLAAGSDDATLNESVIATAPTTLPAYLGSATDRATQITNIQAEVANILDPYNIAVVTARPTSGSYMMVVSTDADSSVLGCTDCPGLAPDDCGSVDNPVAFNFGGGSGSALPIHGIAADTVAELGLSVLGIPTSAVPDDCMCFSDANCKFPPDSQCTIGGAGTAISVTKPGCPATATTMDENELFLDGFGPH